MNLQSKYESSELARKELLRDVLKLEKEKKQKKMNCSFWTKKEWIDVYNITFEDINCICDQLMMEEKR